MRKENEIWKPVDGYRDIYEVSNLGRVKSLRRIVAKNNGGRQVIRGRILKAGLGGHGYNWFVLSQNGEAKTYKASILVWDAFGCGKRLKKTVDHINGDKTCDWIGNLQLLTNRANVSKGYIQKGRKLPTGVYYNKKRHIYYSQIGFNNKRKTLGAYHTASEASLAYQKALLKITLLEAA